MATTHSTQLKHIIRFFFLSQKEKITEVLSAFVLRRYLCQFWQKKKVKPIPFKMNCKQNKTKKKYRIKPIDFKCILNKDQVCYFFGIF